MPRFSLFALQRARTTFVCGYSVSSVEKFQQPSLSKRFFAMSTAKAQTTDDRRPVGRRYFIACDGSWMNSDLGYEQDMAGPVKAQVPSNITRLTRAVKHTDDSPVARGGDPIDQIVFYQRGVGSDDSGVENKLIGGLTGNDLAEHVREAYGFLANNFNPETQKELDDKTKPRDEIVIVGFSRGAFTARAIASIVSDVGLLTRKGMENFWGIFNDWLNQDVAGSVWFQQTYADKYGNEKIPFTDKRYRQQLMDDKLTRWGMPIRAVGVFDTVGALGIPNPWNKKTKELSFVNQKVARQVEHAFHAVALDERRNLFTPTLWENPTSGDDHDPTLKVLKQCWFPGVHSNIGGGYADAGISGITLAWMVSQLEDNDGGIVSFNPDYLDFVQDLNTKAYGKDIRPWGMGRLYDSSAKNSISGFFESIKPITRTPGRYCVFDPNTGEEDKSQPLQNTGECVHRCVRVRINAGGLATEGDAPTSWLGQALTFVKNLVGSGKVGVYDCPVMKKDFELVQSDAVKAETNHSGSGYSGVVWKAKTDGGKDLEEDVLGRTEIRMLQRNGKPLPADT